MICQLCKQEINHRQGDTIVHVRVDGKTLKMVFCLKCADDLILSQLDEGGE